MSHSKKTLRTENGASLELKEGVVLDREGRVIRSFVARQARALAPVLLVFAVPATLVLVFFLLGGFFSLILGAVLLQPIFKLAFGRGFGPRTTGVPR